MDNRYYKVYQEALVYEKRRWKDNINVRYWKTINKKVRLISDKEIALGAKLIKPPEVVSEKVF